MGLLSVSIEKWREMSVFEGMSTSRYQMEILYRPIYTISSLGHNESS